MTYDQVKIKNNTDYENFSFDIDLPECGFRTRRDSIENLRAYSECLKDAVKFSKEASEIIAEDNPRFKIV